MSATAVNPTSKALRILHVYGRYSIYIEPDRRRCIEGRILVGWAPKALDLIA
jgi:hypothetical protein